MTLMNSSLLSNPQDCSTHRSDRENNEQNGENRVLATYFSRNFGCAICAMTTMMQHARHRISESKVTRMRRVRLTEFAFPPPAFHIRGSDQVRRGGRSRMLCTCSIESIFGPNTLAAPAVQ